MKHEFMIDSHHYDRIKAGTLTFIDYNPGVDIQMGDVIVLREDILENPRRPMSFFAGYKEVWVEKNLAIVSLIDRKRREK